MQLEHTQVYRGGLSEAVLRHETDSCSVHLVDAGRSLNFRFHIPSKGGGHTDISLHVGERDVASILNAIAATGDRGIVLLSRAISKGATEHWNVSRSEVKQTKQRAKELAGLVAEVERDATEARDKAWHRDGYSSDLPEQRALVTTRKARWRASSLVAAIDALRPHD